MPPDFRNRLKAILKDRGITAYRLSKDLKLPMSTVQSWIDGSTVARDKNLKKVAEYLRVTDSWLRYGDFKQAPCIQDEVQHICNRLSHFANNHPKKFEVVSKTILFFIKQYEEEKIKK